MPGWKRDVGRRLDALIMRAAPGVRKAVKWNSPLYGVEGQGWFLRTSLSSRKPSRWRSSTVRRCTLSPPGESKNEDTRYLDIRENDAFDEGQFIAWVSRQASCLANGCRQHAAKRPAWRR